MSHNKVTISNNQFKALLVCTTWPHVINYASGILARDVGSDMWISGIIGVLSTLLFIFIIIYIGHNFPGKTLVEYSQDLLWTIPGKFLGFFISISFLIGAASNITMYVHHLTDFLLPETPFIVVTVLHVAVICYLVSKGPEVIARMSVIGFALAIVFIFLVFLASLSEVNFNRILPLFDSGFLKVSVSSLQVDSFIGINQIIIAMILPLVSNQKKAFCSAAVGLSIGSFFFIFYFIAELMVMGPQVVALMRIASMDFVRSIQITQYLHRFESFMVGLWYWSMLVQGSILSYCSLQAFTQTTGIKTKKTKTISIFILSAILVALTYYLGSDRVFFLNLREHIWAYYAVPIEYGLPIILLFIFAIKKAFHAVKN